MSGDPSYDPHEPQPYEPQPYEVDGDGAPDLIASVQGEGVLVMVDTYGDGRFADSVFVTMDELAVIEPELADLLAPNLELIPPSDATYTPVHVDGETTVTESPYWFEQAANGLCVPASVAQIVSSYTGVPFTDEAAFVELANEYGLFWVGPDGVPSMSAEGALFLMEQAGVPASLVVSADLDTLDAYVDAGHGVVLAVSADGIWYGEEAGAAGADHALVVTDIDQVTGVAVLSDPGHPEGNGFTVPLDVVEEAWAASDNTMIVAEQPAPMGSWLPVEGPVVDVPVGVGVAGDEAGTSAGGDGLSVPVGIGGELGAAGRPELHSTVPQAVSWAVQRPWVLLPVAIAAGRLTAR